MSGCRLLISRQIYMKLHYMRTGYIYASVVIKENGLLPNDDTHIEKNIRK